MVNAICNKTGVRLWQEGLIIICRSVFGILSAQLKLFLVWKILKDHLPTTAFLYISINSFNMFSLPESETVVHIPFHSPIIWTIWQSVTGLI